jgi:hypothetical protein
MGRITLFAAATGSQVDWDNGILRGVSVITEGEAKGHGMVIDSTTLEQVKACAETYTDGLRVKMDHYTGIDAMVGVLRNFVIDGTQLRADLHLIKNHDDFEKILEMAENMPGSFGLSISFSGESEGVEIPSDDSEVEPNSGELPTGSVEIVRAARCMEIYSADLVDQPAANPTGLFQAMSDQPAPVEVPAEAPVEEATEEVTAQLEVHGPEGTQHLPEIPNEEVPDPEIPEEEVKEAINSKLSEVVDNFAAQKNEIVSLRADLETARRNLVNMKAEVEKRDLQIASLRASMSSLEETKRLALKAVGLLPSDIVLEVASEATSFNPVAAFAAAVEAGDKKLQDQLFKAHKKEIFAARKSK